MTTLAARCQTATARGGSVTFLSDPGAPRVPWAEMHDDAVSVAAVLQRRGVAPRDVVALLGPTSRSLVTTVQAVWLAGATAMVLPLPQRLRSLEQLVVQARRRVRAAGSVLVAADPALAAVVEPAPGDPPVVGLPELCSSAGPAPAGAYEAPPPDPSALAVLQFTSGATGEPKGVMLSHTAILANLDGVVAAAEVDPGTDVLVSWLPLYHDMGLLGLVTLAMVTGTDLVLAGPQDFAAGPDRWPRWMSEYRATATAGPNVSYALAARALQASDRLDLSRWRIALNGAERVDPSTMDAFAVAGAPHDLAEGAIFPAFGMAELVVAGTFPQPGRGLVTDVVDGPTLERAGEALPVDRATPGAIRLARLGRPLPGLEMRVCDPATGAVLGPRAVGEVEFRGTSVMSGYHGAPDATARAFHDGWLRTGDLAYVADGELVACGRQSDVIVVAGRTLFPEDVERAVAGVAGVRPGNVVAFGAGERGTDGLVVVAEVREKADRVVRRAVAAQVRQTTGLAPVDVVLVAPGTLPKTSSGKLQRGACRARYAERGLRPAP